MFADKLRNLKIAVVAPSAPPLGGGGVSSSHFHLYHLLRKMGVHATLFTFGDNPADSTSAPEDGIVRFGAAQKSLRLLHFALLLYLRARGSKKMAYQLYDIFASAPGAFKVNRCLEKLAPDLVLLPDHGAPGLFIRIHRAKTVLVAHHNPARFIGNPLFGELCPLDARLAVRLEQRALRKIDGVISPSVYMQESFLDTFGYTGPATVIPNVLDPEIVDPVPAADIRKELRLGSNAPVIYIPSAGSRFKGERYVFEIVRRLSVDYGEPLGFYLSGSIQDDLRAELSHLPANARMFLPGQTTYMQNLAYVKSCTFGVYPTLVENFSMAILEANACSVPMVTFDVGGNGEIIIDGENGFLVPYMDIEELLLKSSSMLDNRTGAAMKMRTALVIREKFVTGLILEQTAKFLLDILNDSI